MLTDDMHSHKMADTKEIEGLSEDEICSVFGEQSLKHIIQQFSPLISEVFSNLESHETWDSASMAAKLGISMGDLEDLCAGKQTPATLPLFMKIMASIYWAMSHSAILTRESKFLFHLIMDVQS